MHRERETCSGSSSWAAKGGWDSGESLSGVGKDGVGLLRMESSPVLRAPPDPRKRHSPLRKGVVPQSCGRGPRCAHWIKGRHGIVEGESSSLHPVTEVPCVYTRPRVVGGI